jgi:hypothetical protein
VSQWPVITAGTRLTADLLSSMLPNIVIKPTDLARPSTTTPTNDPDLVTDTLTAAAVYLVEFHVTFGALLAAGLKTAWSVPSGTTGLRQTLGPGSANAAEGNANTTEMKWTVSQFTTQIPYTDPRNSVTLVSHLIEKSLVTMGATAGPINFQWSQNATSATGSVVAANSYVKWQRVG